MLKYHMLNIFRRIALKKFLVTVGILAIYKIAMNIVIPGINMKSIPEFTQSSDFLNTMNIFSGGSVSECSILSTNIMPYITSSIITQMLCSKNLGIEYFQTIKKDREIADIKKNEWTQYFTVIISCINAVYITKTLCNSSFNGHNTILVSQWLFYCIAIPAMVSGSLFCVWIANRISKSGIGQGTSVLIFANILSNSSKSFGKLWQLYKDGEITYNYLMLIGLFFVALFLIVIFFEACLVHFNTQYSGVEGKQMKQKLPLKINNSGVMPAILASSFAHIPTMIVGFFEFFNFRAGSISKYLSVFAQQGSLYYLSTSLLIFFFTITQSEISFDPEEISYNLKESGAIIENVRPGDNTENLLAKTLKSLNFIAGIYLVFVCVLSEFVCEKINQHLGTRILQLSGTSVLILVSTARLVFEGTKDYDYKGLMSSIKN